MKSSGLIPAANAILTEILGEEAVTQRTSGYIVQGVTLKAQVATSHAAIC
jgi:hypothetical protein